VNNETQLAPRIRGIFSEVENRSLTEEEVLEVARRELQALADTYLGEDYNPERIKAVAEVQRTLKIRQGEIARRVRAGELAFNEYASALRDLVTTAATDCEKILGPTDFVKLFGVTAKDAPALASPMR